MVRYAYRDAESGEYVTAEHAKENPSTTVRERVVEGVEVEDDAEEAPDVDVL